MIKYFGPDDIDITEYDKNILAQMTLTLLNMIKYIGITESDKNILVQMTLTLLNIL